MEPEGTHEFKRRRYAATQLIKTYGFGPRQFDFLVQKHPEILGRVYGNHFSTSTYPQGLPSSLQDHRLSPLGLPPS